MGDIERAEIPLVSRYVLDALELEVQDPTAYVDYVHRNLDLWPARYHRLVDAIRREDEVASMDAMLSLRSASEMVGATGLAEIALHMERVLRAGNFVEAEALLPRLEACGIATVDQLTHQFPAYALPDFCDIDWRTLTGQKVEIEIANGITDAGVVDTVTMDGQILWLRQDGAIPRRLVEKGPGVGIRVLSRE
ncbi:Hpt domain-containing protein [Arthrobacter sp. M4]|uniref:Hpt domain-containing protein n=1 Tax=Arthrobacter sp. M4 TaxID=218160 RepID=UPI001CDB7CDD|nr:Hpt domain-containing protein [Arthrobacter sp. M4]MCA4134038.1 hypothetical protein [Arthrobacter sp. M4]